MPLTLPHFVTKSLNNPAYCTCHYLLFPRVFLFRGYLTILNTSVSGFASSGFDTGIKDPFLESSTWVFAAFTDFAHLSMSFAILDTKNLKGK